MLLAHLPPDAATRRALDPENAGWGITEQLMAASVDALRGANWQRGGGKGSRPKPVPRPGIRKARTEHHGRVDRPPAEVAAYLAQFSPASVN